MASKPENRFWKYTLLPEVEKWAHWNRIETGEITPGVPDVELQIIDGPQWFIELKYTDNNRVDIRPSQKRWIRQRHRAGGNAMVLVKVEPKRSPPCYVLFFGVLSGTKKLKDWMMHVPNIVMNPSEINQLQEILRDAAKTKPWEAQIKQSVAVPQSSGSPG